MNGKQPAAKGQLLKNGNHIALEGSQVLLSYYTEDMTVTTRTPAAGGTFRWDGRYSYPAPAGDFSTGSGWWASSLR
jgi:hypothetical protein